MNSPPTEAVKRFIDTGIGTPTVVKPPPPQTRKVEKKSGFTYNHKDRGGNHSPKKNSPALSPRKSGGVLIYRYGLHYLA